MDHFFIEGGILMKKNVASKVYSYLLVLLLIIQLMMGSLSTTVYADSDISTDIELFILKDDIRSTEKDVQAGELFIYAAKYTFASTTSNITGASITIQLPEEVEYVSTIGSNHTLDPIYDENTRELEIPFIEPLPACTGLVQINLRFPNGITPEGTEVSSTAFIKADGTPTLESNQISVTAHADSEWKVSKEKTSPDTDPIPGSLVTYTINFFHEDLIGSGYLNLNNAKLVDTLPTLAEFISAEDGGVYDPDTHTVTWDLGDLDPGIQSESYFVRNVVVKYPDDINESVTNLVVGSGTMVGGQEVNETAEVNHNFGSTESAKVRDFRKYSSERERAIGQRVRYTIVDIGNDEINGNVALDSLIFEDNFPEEFNFTKLSTGGYEPTPEAEYSCKYKTNKNTTWTSWPNRTFTRGTYPNLEVEELNLDLDEYVTGVRLEFPNVEQNFKSKSSMYIEGTLISPDHAGNEVVVGQKFTNTATVTGIYNGNIADVKEASAEITVVAPEPYIYPEKKVVGLQETGYIPEEEVEYELNVENAYWATGDLENPIVVDLLPSELEYVDDSWTITEPEETQPIFEKIDNYNNTGRTLLRWKWEGDNSLTFAPLDKRKITFKVKIKPRTLIGTVTNKYYVTTNTGAIGGTGREYDVSDLDGDGNRFDNIYRGQADIAINPTVSLKPVKWVKGILDDDWTRYDADDVIGSRAKTTPGGTIDYKLVITNEGNTHTREIKIIDILPSVGDKTVYSGVDRGSQWTPSLAEPIVAPENMVVYYSTVSNPDRNELGIDLPNTQPANWSTTPPDDITTVKSVKFEWVSWVVYPGQSIEINWKMTAPIGSPINSVAYDSFAFSAERLNGEKILASEPIKVGVEIKENSKGELGNYVWLDKNENGVQDVDEQGQNGVIVELYDDNDVKLATTTTSNDFDNKPGYYAFSNLNGGNYYIKFQLPYGYKFTEPDITDDQNDSDVDTTSYCTPIINLPSGYKDNSWDAGIILDKPASVGDKIWIDTDENGLQDAGEMGLSNVTVKLFTSNDIFIDTTTTDDNGNYLFNGLYPGDYYILFDTPDGYSISPKNIGDDAAVDSDVDEATGKTEIFTLAVEEENLTMDAGFYLTPEPPAQVASVGDKVWLDVNKDGIQDDSESGLGNITINIYKADDSLVDTTITNGDGLYSFTNLEAGDYYLEFIKPEGYTASTNNMGDDEGKDSDSNTVNGKTEIITLNAGDENRDIDAGFYLTPTPEPPTPEPPTPEPPTPEPPTPEPPTPQPPTPEPNSKIGDSAWVDENQNGIQDADENGLVGVTVKLYDSTHHLIDATITDEKGNYIFDNMKAGKYYLEFIQPETYLITSPNEGGDYQKDSNIDTATGRTDLITLAQGENNFSVDAGFYQIELEIIDEEIPEGTGDISCLGSRVWFDENENNIQDENEKGIEGVTVNLYDINDLLVKTLVTDSNGNYLFTNIPPGQYYVEFVKPEGYIAVAKQIGSNIEIDSDADETTGKTDMVTLVSGETNLTVDAGYYIQQDIILDGKIPTDAPVLPKTGEQSHIWYYLIGLLFIGLGIKFNGRIKRQYN